MVHHDSCKLVFLFFVFFKKFFWRTHVSYFGATGTDLERFRASERTRLVWLGHYLQFPDISKSLESFREHARLWRILVLQVLFQDCGKHLLRIHDFGLLLQIKQEIGWFKADLSLTKESKIRTKHSRQNWPNEQSNVHGSTFDWKWWLLIIFACKLVIV